MCAFWESNPPVLTVSSLLMMLSLTSEKSSLRRCKKRGRRYSIVGSLLSKGASPWTWFAKAARTCCDASCDKSRTQGMIRARITSLSSSLENPGENITRLSHHDKLGVPGICVAAAVRTSASLSLRSWMYWPSSSSRTRSAPTASASFVLGQYVIMNSFNWSVTLLRWNGSLPYIAHASSCLRYSA